MSPEASEPNLAENDALVRVEADAIGVSKQVFQRAKLLSGMCRLSSRGGKSINTHVPQFAERFGNDTEQCYQNDLARIKTELEALNTRQQKHGRARYETKLFRTKKQQAAIFYNDDEIIVSFHGSDITEPLHFYRNLIQSRISYHSQAFFREDARTKSADYEQKIADLASHYAADAGEERDQLIKSLKGAKVHGGWWDTLMTLDYMHGPNQYEGKKFWPAIEQSMEDLESEIRARTGKSPKICFTGHSSGGCLALIAAAHWMENTNHSRIHEIYTFGQPRVGNVDFRNALYKMMGNGSVPIYRFEMVGDPIPSMPPLWSRLIHIGNWICIAPNGNLAALKHEDGRVITAAEAGRQIGRAMTSVPYLESPKGDVQFDRKALRAMSRAWEGKVNESPEEIQKLLDQMEQHFLDPDTKETHVTAPQHQQREIWRNSGGLHAFADRAMSGLKVLFNFGAHLSKVSSYRHSLTAMQEGLRRQIRMETLRQEQGSCYDPQTLERRIFQLVNNLRDAWDEGKITEQNVPNAEHLIDQIAFDHADFASALLSDNAGFGKPLMEAGGHLAIERGRRHGSLIQLEKALKSAPELEHLRNEVKLALYQMEYFLATHAPIALDKSRIRYTSPEENGHGNGGRSH
ncbi:MAG: lipase family protein [Alphaproteobacteria bacterium]|nr:lipase family protein [Alphaproteobacteria bacterium]